MHKYTHHPTKHFLLWPHSDAPLYCRMFVKVTVSYQEGGRSSPLDLLLYDSQCWHCSLAGECNARPNNKCVFSAAGGSSSVQTFRIGKSITNSEGIVINLIIVFIFLILVQTILTFAPWRMMLAVVTERSSDTTTTHWRLALTLIAKLNLNINLLISTNE